jgi:uncharacterized protein YqgV (UPF0045/DUF77 family)
VLSVLSDGTSGVLYEMTPLRTTIEELSRDAVTRAVLAASAAARRSRTAEGE